MSVPYYPINDFGPLMKGLIIGAMGISHVFLAQFAIGGGILMCYFQWLAQTGRSPLARRFLDSFFKVLVLISFVAGALLGVGMWFTTIQISPRTIGLMVHEFHWIWACEYTFFFLEIVAGYAFYRNAARLTDRARMWLLVLYTVGAWMSLFLINGILAWQLTPGGWVQNRNIWSGFFNPSFWPSLLFRTVVSMTIAALVACVVIGRIPNLDRGEKVHLVNRATRLLLPMVIMPVLAWWYLASIPRDSRSWLLGGSAAMTMFMTIAVGASLLIGIYALAGVFTHRPYISRPAAILLTTMAFAATAGGEFVREGVRKPFSIRRTLYSNSLLPSEVARLREVGSVTYDPYPLRDAQSYPNDQVRLGAKVFRFQCSVCHTVSGTNGLVDLTASWRMEQKRLNIAKLQYTKPFMPPFAGTAAELEALVQWVTWQASNRLSDWPAANDPQTLRQIQTWLDEAGVGSGFYEQTGNERFD